MSAPINDGGPAFPGISGESGCGNETRVVLPDGGNAWIGHNQGMTLRDYIAITAMQAVLSGLIARGEGPTHVGELSYLSKQSYLQADTMLAERAKKP